MASRLADTSASRVRRMYSLFFDPRSTHSDVAAANEASMYRHPSGCRFPWTAGARGAGHNRRSVIDRFSAVQPVSNDNDPAVSEAEAHQDHAGEDDHEEAQLKDGVALDDGDGPLQRR
jgi:hypothetical protein